MAKRLLMREAAPLTEITEVLAPEKAYHCIMRIALTNRKEKQSNMFFFDALCHTFLISYTE